MGIITLLILIFQNIVSRLLFICAKNVIEEKKSCNKKICLKNHFVIHLELLATYAILPFIFFYGSMKKFNRLKKKKKKRRLQVYLSSIETKSQVPIIRHPMMWQAQFYGTFFKCRSIRHIADSRALFVQKYPAIRNVPDKFWHTFKLQPACSSGHCMCMRKVQRSSPLAAASRNIHQNKHLRFVYTRSLPRVGASFVLWFAIFVHNL